MTKIISLLATLASLNFCLTVAFSSGLNQRGGRGPLDPSNQKVDCDGRIYGPSKFSAVRNYVMSSGDEEQMLAMYGDSLHLDGNELHFDVPVYQNFNGRNQIVSTDNAVFSGLDLDVVDFMIVSQDGTRKRCQRSAVNQ
ncbi:hypothetical protein K3495_g1755 [Podosphaera aphanis]|nr:hypothetical protein K3495_g1755 [Podosphaera aphanis]